MTILRLLPTLFLVLLYAASIAMPASASQELYVKSASSPTDTGASSYENKSGSSIKSSIKSAQRYEKVTDIASSLKEQTLLHITLSNGQTIQATAGHPFKTLEGWRDAVMLKNGGQLLLKGADESEAKLPLPIPLAGEGRGEGAFNHSSERYATITDIREEVKTTSVFNLEVANLHSFFVGVDGVLVHNGLVSDWANGIYERVKKPLSICGVVIQMAIQGSSYGAPPTNPVRPPPIERLSERRETKDTKRSDEQPGRNRRKK